MNDSFNEMANKIKEQCEYYLEKVLLNLEHIKSIKSKEYWTTIYINTSLTKNDIIKAYQKGIDEYKLTLNK